MREKLYVVLSRAVDAVGGVLFLKLISTFVPKVEVGAYLLMASLLAIVTALSTSALDVGIMRHVDAYRLDGTLSKRYSSVLTAYLVVGLLLLCAASVFAASDFGLGHLAHETVALSLWFSCDVVRSFALNLAGSLRARGRVLFASLFEQCLRVGLLLYLSMRTPLDAHTIVYLLCFASFSSATVCIYAQRALLVTPGWQQVASTFIEAFKFVWPMMVWAGFSWLQNMSSRWVLNYFCGPADVAEFCVFVIMANFPIAALQGVFSTYLQPILYERENMARGSSRILIRQAAFALMLACALLVGVFAAFHHELVAMLSSKGYSERSYMVPWLMLSISCSAIGSVYALSVYVERRLHLLMLANIIPGVVVAVLGVMLVKYNGLSGAVLAFCAGHVLSGLFFFVAHRKSYAANALTSTDQ